MSEREPTCERKVLTLLVEMRCNSYCVFCGQREVDEPLIRTRRRLGLSVPQTAYGDTRGRYTLKTASEALLKARDDGYDELSLQGGEPTIWPDLVPLVAEARRLGFRFVGLVTNGRKLKERAFTEALLDAGLDGLTASILGADAATHDAIAAAPGSFDAMIEGLKLASSIARQRGTSVKINANVITTAKSVGALPEQMRLLAAAGVSAASVHLVRFAGLASDPKVKAELRFDIRRITGALREAAAEAERLGIRLHATDIPQCLHPTLKAEELALLQKRGGIVEHHYEAAAFRYDVDLEARRTRPAVCGGCLLDRICERVPPEYLPEDPADALRPLTSNSIELFVNETIAALDPASPGASEALVELDRAASLLSALCGRPEALVGARARIQEAMNDLIPLALRRYDFPGAMGAFCARLGIRCRIELRTDQRAWASLATPLADLAAKALAITAEDASRFPLRMRIGGELDVALDGEEAENGAIAIRAARPVIRPARSPAERAMVSLFLVVFCAPLRRAKRLRLDGASLEIDIGGGLHPAFEAWRSGAIRVDRTPAH